MTPGTKIGLILALAMFAVVGGYFLVVPDERPSGLSEAGGDDISQTPEAPELIRTDHLTDTYGLQSGGGGNGEFEQGSSGPRGVAQDDGNLHDDSFNGASTGGNDLFITFSPSGEPLQSAPEIPDREVASFEWNPASSEAPFTGTTSFIENDTQPATPIANGAATIREPAPGGDTYIVQKGDSFWSIAHAWYGDGTRMDLIVKANPGVNPDRLQIGQKLVLPARDSARANQAAAADAPPRNPNVGQPREPLRADAPGTHTVREGDTLVRIARQYFKNDSKWEAIYAANRALIGPDPDKLKLGMRLTIPR